MCIIGLFLSLFQDLFWILSMLKVNIWLLSIIGIQLIHLIVLQISDSTIILLVYLQ